jgi:hypothetical protein
MEQISKTEDMNTMSQCVNKLESDGYTEQFRVDEKGKLYAPSVDKSYKAEKVHILNFFRFEGASDPDENSILYAIQTDDGTKGMLTDAYGAYADPNVSKFIKQVEDIAKKNPKPVGHN